MDREKVIADIEEQIAWIRDNDFHKFPGWGHVVLAMKDAIALLKEQEAVEPDTDSEGTCTCGVCGETVGYYPVGCNVPQKLCKFCPECGNQVKW